MRKISSLSLTKIAVTLTIIVFGHFVDPETTFAAKAKHRNFFTVNNVPGFGKINCLRTAQGVVAGKKKGQKVVALSKDLAPLNKSLKKAQRKNKAAKIAQISSKIAALTTRIQAIQSACSANDPLNPPPGPSSPQQPNPNPPNFNDPVPSEDPADSLSLEPLDRPIQAEDVRYLFEKAGFGFSQQEWPFVDFAINHGVSALVDNFMAHRNELPEVVAEVEDLRDGERGVVDQETAYGQRLALYKLWSNTSNPYEERMALFLLGVWTVSIEVIDVTFISSYWNYLNRLRTAAANDTNLENLALEITKDPLMLIFLNNELNVKGKPNENFARELMELFTLGPRNLDGVANYTETQLDGSGDIAVAAKMLTGFKVTKNWTNKELIVSYVSNRHQPGPHTMFPGTVAQFTGENYEDLVRGIFARHPGVKYFYATEILKEYLTPNPPRDLVIKLGQLIHANGYKLRPTMNTFLKSKAFFSHVYKNTLPKSGVEFFVESVKTLGMAPVFRFENFGWQLTELGMEVNEPPSVFWYPMSAWTGPATTLKRANILSQLLGDDSIAPGWTIHSVLPSAPMNSENFIRAIANLTGTNNLTVDLMAALSNYLNTERQWNGQLTNLPAFDNTNAARREVKGGGLFYLLAALPDYQLK